jgi:hypothetical protein
MRHDSSRQTRTASTASELGRTPATPKAIVAATLLALVPVFAVWSASFPVLAAAAVAGGVLAFLVVAAARAPAGRRRVRVPGTEVRLRV